MASIVGKALRGFGRALRAHRIKHGKRGKTISSVKPHSGKIPWYVGAGKTPEARKGIVRTHFSLKRSDKIDKAVKDIKEGHKTLKHMEATGQAEEIKNYKGEGTGQWHKKGFDR